MKKWACNIGLAGRIMRFLMGLLFAAAGIYLVGWQDAAFWGTGLIALGAFGMFEGIAGWCALRSLGIDTPL